MAFVYDAWLESFRESHAAGPIPMPMYRRVYREVITWYLERPGVQLLVACNNQDTDQVFGFLAHETGAFDRSLKRVLPCVHFVYVKQPFRKFGVGKALFTGAGIDPSKPFMHTFKTPEGTEVSKAKKYGANWRPLYGRFPKREDTNAHEASGSPVR